MPQTKNFSFALGISILAHLSIILSLSALNILPQPKPFKPIEVIYLKTKPRAPAIERRNQKAKPLEDILDTISPGQRLILSTKDKIPQNNIPNLEIERNILLTKSNPALQKSQLTKVEFSHPDAIKLSAIEMESSAKLSQNPVYLTYSNFLREGIRRCLYNKFSDINDKGIVCIKFALSQDGTLLEYHIVDTKSIASQRLKRLAVDGLRDAAPFPPLPKELDSPVATFSVIIHFIEQ